MSFTTTRKSLDKNNTIYMVYEATDVHGVFTSMKDAKRYVIKRSLEGLDVSHYHPEQRFKQQDEKYSLSKSRIPTYEDTWITQSGTPQLSIHAWIVDVYPDPHKKPICVTTCTMDSWIKTQIFNAKLSQQHVMEMIDKWKAMLNYELFYESCFTGESDYTTLAPMRGWINIERTLWNTIFESSTQQDKRFLTKHASLMVRR